MLCLSFWEKPTRELLLQFYLCITAIPALPTSWSSCLLAICYLPLFICPPFTCSSNSCSSSGTSTSQFRSCHHLYLRTKK